jgi:hypothetical protein
MTDSHKQIILLITDDAAEESHTAHILAKYHFDNFLVKLRKPGDAIKYFQACNAPEDKGAEALPELIIQGLRESGRLNLAPIMESRRGAVGTVPLIVVVASPEEEGEISRLNLAITACVSRPIGFFKLLEAMQKLEMRWIVLKPK